MRRRIEAIVTVVLAVIVFGVAGYVLLHHDAVPQAGETLGYSDSSVSGTVPPTAPPASGSPASGASGSGASGSGASGSGSSAPSPSGSPSGPASLASARVAFVGDDYTAGAGASDRAHGFVALVRAGLNVTNSKAFSVPGGGYAKPSTEGKDYAGLLRGVVAYAPDVVIITGGRNDTNDAQDTLTAAADSLFAKLHKQLPGAVLIAVSPFWGDSPAPPEISLVGAMVKSAIESQGGHYVELPDPLLDHPEFMADEADPNDKGHAAIATALVAALQTTTVRVSG